MSFMTRLNRSLKSMTGATAIEYGLIAALISVAAIAAFTTVGAKLSSWMANIEASSSK